MDRQLTVIRWCLPRDLLPPTDHLFGSSHHRRKTSLGTITIPATAAAFCLDSIPSA